jgi:hypothetical protein
MWQKKVKMTLHRSALLVSASLLLALAGQARGQDRAGPCDACSAEACNGAPESIFEPPCPAVCSTRFTRQCPVPAESKFEPRAMVAGKAHSVAARIEAETNATEARPPAEVPPPPAVRTVRAQQEREPPPLPLQPERPPLRLQSELAAGPESSHSALRPWKWTTLVAGAVLVGGGIALLAVDGHAGDQCWMPGTLSTCKQVLQTQPAGAALVAVGGASLIGATVLFVLDARRERKRPWLALAPSIPSL